MKTIKQLIEEENIKSVAELFTKHPDRWMQGSGPYGSRDASKQLMEDRSLAQIVERACYVCVLHAASYFDPAHNASAASAKLAQVLPEEMVFMWNDDPSRTVEEVVAVAQKAGI